VTPRVFRFGNYELDVAARELRRDGELLPLPRRIFDGLAHLVEHRDRAVGHDELIATLWGRVDVANAQVSQLIMQVRRAVGDDSNAQRRVRTVSGFGYRWIAATEEVAAADEAPHRASTPVVAAASQPAVPAAQSAVGNHASTRDVELPAAPSEIVRPGSTRRRWPIAWLLCTCALAAAAVAVFFHIGSLTPFPGERARAIAVLPFDVNATERSDSAWIRLGAMDLVANRLRQAGLPVPPSDSVVAAVHAAAALPAAERIAALRRTLGADTLVQGVVSRSATGWTIELTAIGDKDVHRRVEAEHAQVIDTARQASDLLLAALGVSVTGDAAEGGERDEYLQRARAALLANELDAARSILTDVPAALRNDPELRCELARVEFHAGNFDAARELAKAVLDDPGIRNKPRLRAQALRIRGWIATTGDVEDWAAAERDFDAAVQVLNGEHASSALGKVLAERGVARVFLRRFDEAVIDLGQAHSQLEIAGDRQGLGEMNNYLGQLELMRRRTAESVRYFAKAAAIAESFGAVDALRYNLTAMLGAQMHLLRWPDALATSERLWSLRGRIENAGLRASVDGYRASVLLAVGRRTDAELVLSRAGGAGTDVTPSMQRFIHWARADLAWQKEQPDQAFAAASEALKAWPEKSATDSAERAHLALLRQRASLASGHPVPADIAAFDPSLQESVAVYRLVAEAEWADHLGNVDQAERSFREAAAVAETQGVPDTIALAAQAQAYWLIAHGEPVQASARAGRIATWADQDFGCALLQVAAFHANGETDAWARALGRARALAGQRAIPPSLLVTPATRGN
jgi:DNA-binding winged helix-turn-helix (wHTH) protein/tetratricopeptide (TPR) repeat protein